MVEWEEIIDNQKTQMAHYELALAIRTRPHSEQYGSQGSTGLMLGVTDGTEEFASGETTTATKSIKKNKNKNKNKNRKIRDKQEKLAAPEQGTPTVSHEEAVAQAAKEQEIRHEMAKIPKSQRMELCMCTHLPIYTVINLSLFCLGVAAHASGEGSIGVVRQSKLRPKPSMNVFDMFRSEQDRKDEEKKKQEEDRDGKSGDSG